MTHNIIGSKRRENEHELKSLSRQILINFPQFSKHLAKAGLEDTKTGNNRRSSKIDFIINTMHIQGINAVIIANT